MAINATLNIKLHSNQKLIEASPARIKAIKAGKRFGKSVWAIFSLLKKAGLHPGVYWYVAPTYNQAKNIAWREMLNMVPPSLIRRKRENDLMVELVMGSEIRLLGAENEDALRGVPIDGLVCDEAAYMKEHIWPNILSGQVLGNSRNPDSFAYFISSPNKNGKNWFSHFWDEIKARADAGDKDYAAFYFSIFDNGTLKQEAIEMIKRQCSDFTWNLEYLAQESDFAGRVYSEFDELKHVRVYDHSMSPNISRVRSIDWGLAHPTVCLFLLVDLDRQHVYVYDEYYKTGALVEESCNNIKARSGTYTFEWTTIDPSTARRDGVTNLTNKQAFDSNGVYCIPGDNRSRGIDIVKMFFKKGMISIHPKCRNLINELKTFEWGDKEGDDCGDALRYALVRIHDFVFGGKNVFDREDDNVLTKQHTFTPMSIQDLIFKTPKQVAEVNWLIDEIGDGY